MKTKIFNNKPRTPTIHPHSPDIAWPGQPSAPGPQSYTAASGAGPPSPSPGWTPSPVPLAPCAAVSVCDACHSHSPEAHI